MRRFAALYKELDSTTSTNAKVDAMVRYFREVPAADAAWAVYSLAGGRLKRLVKTGLLRSWVAELTGYPAWLIEDSYAHVGDLAETIALLLDEPGATDADIALHVWMEQRLSPLAKQNDEQKRAEIIGWWRQLPADQRFVLNKLITGSFRVGVSRRLVTRALAELAQLDSGLIAHRLMGRWQPSAQSFQALLAAGCEDEPDPSLPYPFFLASPLEDAPSSLGDPEDWAAEWKWDGIRAQLIRREEQTFLWSRGEEALEDRFPELRAAAEVLPEGTVIDGEILAWRDGAPLPFAVLQRRIGRKKVGPQTLATAPCALLAYDLIEHHGADIREQPYCERRKALAAVIAQCNEQLRLSDELPFSAWETLASELESARERGVEGFILKRSASPYRVGRKRGDWWKLKVDPYTVDAVLLYAQPGHGRRSNLLTDYTFAVWQDQSLVPFAKAYSGLTDKEIRELDRWIRNHTTDRFGPVRAVEPELVFELAFEGINRSKRHKSGIAVRFPRISRWRRDLAIRDADALGDIEGLLPDEA